VSKFRRFGDPKASFFGGVVLLVLALVGWFAYSNYGPKAPQPLPMTASETTTPENTEQPEAEAAIPPSFDVVRISRGGTGVIAGRAFPGSRVEIYAAETLIGIVDADANGEWVVILEEPLASGPAELSLLALLFGKDPLESRNIVVLSVPEREIEESPTEGVVALLTPRDGVGQSRVLQKPGATPLAEIGDSLTIDTLDYGEEGEMIIAGRAVPRAQVALYLDNKFLGAAKASDDGFWSYERQENLAKGAHALRIDQLINEGNVQLRIEQPFEAGLPIDRDLQEGKVVVQPGNSLWHIARRIYGSGFRYTVIFQENADQIRDPDLIYPGQMLELPRLGPESGPGR
jgi:nucleoid-associated protein YgaU